MTKKEKQKLFSDNFNRQAYEQAKAKVESLINQPNSFEFMVQLTSGYDEEEDDNGEGSFYCEVELDRSQMQTEADYVSVEFIIGYAPGTKQGRICATSLYVGYPNGLGGELCWFDPNTCEMAEWYGI